MLNPSMFSNLGLVSEALDQLPRQFPLFLDRHFLRAASVPGAKRPTRAARRRPGGTPGREPSAGCPPLGWASDIP